MNATEEDELARKRFELIEQVSFHHGSFDNIPAAKMLEILSDPHQDAEGLVKLDISVSALVQGSIAITAFLEVLQKLNMSVADAFKSEKILSVMKYALGWKITPLGCYSGYTAIVMASCPRRAIFMQLQQAKVVNEDKVRNCYPENKRYSEFYSWLLQGSM